MLKKLKIFLVLCLMWIVMLRSREAKAQQEANLSHWREVRQREKRFLIFEKQGVIKLVGALAFPMDLLDRRVWRSLLSLYSLQWQYGVPLQPSWMFWANWVDDRRSLGEKMPPLLPPSPPATDEAQVFLYQFIEEFMNQRGVNGTACLHRAICENAQIDRHDGLFAEILKRILTPHKNFESPYLEAQSMGRHGVDCYEVFSQAKGCWLENFLYIKDENFIDQPQTLSFQPR